MAARKLVSLGLAHFARNLGLPDLAGKELINIFTIVGGV